MLEVEACCHMELTAMISSHEARKSPRYPTNEEYYTIYKYCIERKNATQNGVSVSFRVLPRIVAQEFNKERILNYDITDHHVRKAVDLVTDWQILLSMVPEPQETVLEDQLKAKITANNILIENLKLELASLKKGVNINSNAILQVQAAYQTLGRAISALPAVTAKVTS